MATQPAIKSDSDNMFGEMKKRPTYTEAELDEFRKQWVSELDSSRMGYKAVTDIAEAIYRLEQNADTIKDVMHDKELNGHYSCYLQAAFDDTMDILDYLKKLA